MSGRMKIHNSNLISAHILFCRCVTFMYHKKCKRNVAHSLKYLNKVRIRTFRHLAYAFCVLKLRSKSDAWCICFDLERMFICMYDCTYGWLIMLLIASHTLFSYLLTYVHCGFVASLAPCARPQITIYLTVVASSWLYKCTPSLSFTPFLLMFPFILQPWMWFIRSWTDPSNINSSGVYCLPALPATFQTPRRNHTKINACQEVFMQYLTGKFSQQKRQAGITCRVISHSEPLIRLINLFWFSISSILD